MLLAKRYVNVLSGKAFCKLPVGTTATNPTTVTAPATRAAATIPATTVEMLKPDKFGDAYNTNYPCKTDKASVTKRIATTKTPTPKTTSASKSAVTTPPVGLHICVVLKGTIRCHSQCDPVRGILPGTLRKGARGKQRQAHSQAQGAGNAQFSQFHHRGSLSFSVNAWLTGNDNIPCALGEKGGDRQNMRIFIYLFNETFPIYGFTIEIRYKLNQRWLPGPFRNFDQQGC